MSGTKAHTAILDDVFSDTGTEDLKDRPGGVFARVTFPQPPMQVPETPDRGAVVDRFANPLSTQVGGGHYKDCAIQPVEFIHANGLTFIEGSVVKYVSRWRKKGGIQDLKKAKHFLEMLIELEEKTAPAAS